MTPILNGMSSVSSPLGRALHRFGTGAYFGPSFHHRSAASKQPACGPPLRAHIKGYPSEVAVPAGSRFRGVILADQGKSLDWRQRKAQERGRCLRRFLIHYGNESER